MVIKVVNKLLKRCGYIVIKTEVLDSVIRMSISHLAALQKHCDQNEVVVYDGDSGTSEVVTLH